VRDDFVHYEQGNPEAVVAPDVFMVMGVPEREDDPVSAGGFGAGSPARLAAQIRSTPVGALDRLPPFPPRGTRMRQAPASPGGRGTAWRPM